MNKLLCSFPFLFQGCTILSSIISPKTLERSFFFLNKFIYFCLCWVFVAVCGLSLVVVGGGYSLLWWLLLLRSMGCRHTGSAVVARRLQSSGSVVVAHGLSCSAHVGSSRTSSFYCSNEARTHVPCIGRQILNHCITREALFASFK